MNWEEFETAFKELQERKLALMRDKNADYAGRADVFANFRGIAAATLQTPEQTFLHFMACKIVRLANLFKSGEAPANESIQDSAIDLANYADLLAVFISAHKCK